MLERQTPQVGELAGGLKHGAAEVERSKTAYVARKILALLLASMHEHDRYRGSHLHQRPPEHVSGRSVFHRNACRQQRTIRSDRAIHIHKRAYRQC